MSESLVLVERDEPVAVVQLNRPKQLNALSDDLMSELVERLQELDRDDGIRCIVLAGSERAFAAGADIGQLAEASTIDLYYQRRVERWDTIRELWTPLVAAVSGFCLGGGCELAMACDLAVMVDDAFIRHVGPEHGSVPAGGATQWLAIMVGDRRAREIVFMCEEIPAKQAEEWGLVNWAVPAAELDKRTDEVVENLARKLPQTTRYAKQHMNFWRDLAWHETINHARDWLALSMATDEPKAAIEKFLKK